MSERLAKAADFSEQLRAARTGTRGAHGKEMSESETGWRPERLLSATLGSPPARL